MSNYRTHSLFNLLFCLPLLVLGCRELLHFGWTLTLIGSGGFAYGTLFMSPDMDMANRIKLFSLRGLLTLPFRSYAKLFRHRGLSHSPIFGTLTRVLWLSLHLIPLLWLSSWPLLPLLPLLVGLLIADWCHLLLDRFGPAV